MSTLTIEDRDRRFDEEMDKYLEGQISLSDLNRARERYSPDYEAIIEGAAKREAQGNDRSDRSKLRKFVSFE